MDIMEDKIKQFFMSKVPSKEPKQSSLDMYIRDVTRLLKGMGVEYESSEQFVKNLENMDAVREWLDRTPNPKSDATKRNYYSAVLVVCQSYGLEKKLCDHYATIRDNLNLKLLEKKEQAKLTPNQKENMVERAEIIGAIGKLSEKVHSQPIPLIADHKDLLNLQLLTLLRLYETIPARNEMAELLYMPKVLYEGIIGGGTPSHMLQNYLVHDKDDPHIPFMISLNDYKTSAHHGERRFIITQDTPYGMMITAYFTHLLQRRGLGYHSMDIDFNDHAVDEEHFATALNGTPVFYTNWNAGKFRPMTKNDLTKSFNKFFKGSIGKNISTTILAKSLLQEEVGEAMSKKLKELALARGHSVSTMLGHYV